MKNSYFTHNELKQALKKFKAQRDDVQNPQVVLFLNKYLHSLITVLCCINSFEFRQSSFAVFVACRQHCFIVEY